MAPYVGYAAGALSVSSYVPQTIRAWRTRKTDDLSYGMFALLMLASALWIAFGVLVDQWPVILPNAGCLIFAFAIFCAKLRYD